MKQRCAWCGREYDGGEPPCDTCGHGTFEPVSDDGSPFDSGSLVWVCSNCGREHVKHSPPCSRCGNHDLEKRAADVADEMSSPGYLSVGKPYIVGIVAVVALVGLVAAGIVPLPGASGPPAPPDAPGDADQSGGLDLAVAESALHDRLNADRRDAGGTDRIRDPGLDAFAEYATRHRVAERYDPAYDGTIPELRAFEPQCGGSPSFGIAEPSIDAGGYDDETAFADGLADALLAERGFAGLALDDRGAEGIDVHVGPDGTVFVGYIAC